MFGFTYLSELIHEEFCVKELVPLIFGLLSRFLYSPLFIRPAIIIRMNSYAAMTSDRIYAT